MGRDFLGFLQLTYSATRSQLPHRTIMIIGVYTLHNTKTEPVPVSRRRLQSEPHHDHHRHTLHSPPAFPIASYTSYFHFQYSLHITTIFISVPQPSLRLAGFVCKAFSMPASVAASETEDDEVRHEIHEIDILLSHGINKSDIDRLKANGFHTVGVCSSPSVTWTPANEYPSKSWVPCRSNSRTSKASLMSRSKR